MLRRATRATNPLSRREARAHFTTRGALRSPSLIGSPSRSHRVGTFRHHLCINFIQRLLGADAGPSVVAANGGPCCSCFFSDRPSGCRPLARGVFGLNSGAQCLTQASRSGDTTVVVRSTACGIPLMRWLADVSTARALAISFVFWRRGADHLRRSLDLRCRSRRWAFRSQPSRKGPASES